jgi:hypothetical protein
MQLWALFASARAYGCVVEILYCLFVNGTRSDRFRIHTGALLNCRLTGDTRRLSKVGECLFRVLHMVADKLAVKGLVSLTLRTDPLIISMLFT